MKVLATGFVLLGAATLFSAPHGAHAQSALRTWVSGTGDDAFACSFTAPCKTFAGALSKTASGGEINCLNSASFGLTTINKAITISCRNTIAGVSNTAGNAFIVNAPGAQVLLQGLDIQAFGRGSSTGLRVAAVGHLTIRDSRISGQGADIAGQGVGVSITPSASATVQILDTLVTGNLGGGILVQPTGSAVVDVVLKNVSADQNLYGLRAADRARVTAVNSSFSGNTNNGVVAVASAQAAEVVMIDAMVVGNGVNGVATSGAGARVRILGSTVSYNGTGLNAAGGGVIATVDARTNLISGNAVPGAPNGLEILR